MSGGGYRAALFHLGVCRRLNEVGTLRELDAISSVSGGSIFAAHLATAIIRHGADVYDHYESLVATPFRAFVKNDIRTAPSLARLAPWEWANAGAGAEALVEQYATHLLGGEPLTVADLPDRPRFIFCATDLVFGVNWVFSKDRVGSYRAGHLVEAARKQQLIAKAVAASSCFPPVFRPLPLRLTPADFAPSDYPVEPDHDSKIAALVLSDGGVYDNMGLEPVWKSCANVIVSDGGKPFSFSKDGGSFAELYRIHDVMANQAEAMRRRWLIASYVRQDYGGAYLGINNAVTDYPLNSGIGYSKSLATSSIATIRTDMDCFGDEEIAVLENHGYTLADAACRSHLAGDLLVAPPPLLPLANGWWPGPARLAAAQEEKIAAELADSSHVRILGHRFS
jgi:NTE family protein